MEIDITKLREERRPLWMSPLEIDDYADMLGNGGDIWTDRLVPAWERHYGSELTENELSMLDESGENLEANMQTQGSAHRGEESSGLDVNVDLDVKADVSGISETVSSTVSGVTDTVEGLLGGVKKKVKDTIK